MESARKGRGRVIDLPIEEYIVEDGNLLYVALREQDTTPMAQSYADGFLSGPSA
jgi:hypothetical protein